MENNRLLRLADYTAFAGIIAGALILTIIVLPAPVAAIRPDFVALALIFLAFHYPARVGVISALFVGLLADVITFGVLGQHAMAKVVIVYCAVRFLSDAKTLKWQAQTVCVLVLLYINSTVIAIVNIIAHETPGPVSIWLAPLAGALVWLMVVIIRYLRQMRHHGIAQ